MKLKRKYGERDSYIVGVLGYPNVGKSSLINAMAGRHAAPASHISGQTKSLRRVKGDNRLKFLDTPGVLPFQEKDEEKHALIGALDFNKVKDPDLAVMALMEENPGLIEKFYEVEVLEDLEETIESIAIKRNLLKKGAKPDIDRTSRMILKDWQTGKINHKRQ